MLHNSKNTGCTRGHPYPKVMLSFMLVLQHWRDTNYCGYEMMKTNMSIFNEELGELTFSILARSTLGDHTKDSFEHMDKLFKLLRVYRDVKSDVVADNSSSNSLNWRHKIQKDGPEVKTSELFFQQIIRQMVNGTHRSYDGSAKGYSSALKGAQLKVVPTSPAVYLSSAELTLYVHAQLAALRVDMNTNFLFQYRHIWPECVNHDDEHKGDLPVVQLNVLSAVSELKNEEWGDVDDDVDDVVREVNVAGRHQEFEEDQDSSEDESHDEESEAEDADPDENLINPYDSRGWNAWGTVNEQNRMLGKRIRKKPNRLVHNQRRRGGKFPDSI
jgi:hypothetical protein